MKIEKICDTMPFENGSSPAWSRGNSPMVRVGDRVFATNARVHEDRFPFNRTTMELWEKRDGEAWKKVYEDDGVFQREPCPVAYLGNNRLAVTVNPTARAYAKDEPSRVVACVPMLYVFDISGEPKRTDVIRLRWDRDDYNFLDHSYRSMAVDSVNGNLLLTNIHYSGEEEHLYALLGSDLTYKKHGKLCFPERSCYHNIAMKDGEVYLFAVQDIVEPNEEWKAYKRQVTGAEWDFDFRTIYLNYCPDVERGDFEPSLVVCEREATCGWTNNYDCCYDQNGDMLFLASSQNIHHAFMKEKFFPDEPLETILEVYRFSAGRLVEKTEIDRSKENGNETKYSGFFHTAADGEVYLVWCKKTDVAENPMQTGAYLTRTSDLRAKPVKLMDDHGWLFGSKTRLGGEPSDIMDMYWCREEAEIMYARHDLKHF